MSSTAAHVDIKASNNATLADAFRFGKTGDTSWDFVDKTFEMEVKASRDDVAPLLTLTSADNEIIVDDTVTRVLHLNVTPTALQAALPVGRYVYDLMMLDDAVPPVVTQLMKGHLEITQGVTET